MEKYLRIENNSFGFVVKGVHEIASSDIVIVESDYNKFFELQNKGKQFRLKANPIGSTLFDYIEEYTLECIPCEPTEEELLKEEVLNQSEMMLDMDYRMTSLELGL